MIATKRYDFARVIFVKMMSSPPFFFRTIKRYASLAMRDIGLFVLVLALTCWRYQFPDSVKIFLIFKPRTIPPNKISGCPAMTMLTSLVCTPQS